MSYKPIPINIISKVWRSVCKIKINELIGSLFATGFFLKVSDSLKYLVTNEHAINKDTIKRRSKI